MESSKKVITPLQPQQRLYQSPKLIVAITGGIACGKSTVSDLFKKLTPAVMSADNLISEIYQKNETILFFQSNFPQFVSQNPQNQQLFIDKSQLRKHFFNNISLRENIEKYLFSQLPHLFLRQLANIQEPFIIYEVPLLFEKVYQGLVDIIIAVHCSYKTQLSRLKQRNEMTDELAQTFLENQLSLEEKIKGAHFSLDTDADIAEIESEVAKLYQIIQSVCSEL